MAPRRLVDECPTTPSKADKRILNSPASKNANNMVSLLGNKIEALPRTIQFITLALSVFFFFGIHNVLQEAMINTEGFTFGVMLGWMEVLGVTLCSGLERSSLPFIGNGEAKKQMVAPICAYPLLTLCLSMSSSLASWSLNYINFPTKVVFRSCKLLPTMLLAVVMGNSKRFTVIEIGSAMAVCAGLITFAAGDWSLSKPQFHPFGLTLVTLSVFADAVLPNAQEKIFRTYDASKSEVMFFTNVFTLMIQTGSTLLSGDLMGFVHFVMGKPKVEETNYFSIMMATTTDKQHRNLFEEESLETSHGTGLRRTFLLHVIAYVLISHVAVSAHTQVVRKFGGVAAVFVGTARKGMTLILSFVLFPKESNWKYAAGAALVLGGLTVASLEKQRNRKKDSTVVADGSKLPFPEGSKRSDPLELPNLPLDEINDGIQDDAKGSDVEHQPLLDVEMGSHRSSTSSNNAPQRRR
uniref:Sugar phosphate transporter domain-containing protein n=1 Tax=Skeletonema marinoi TaxID=267567 RepID=A0A7S2PXH6_9STRA|mmetsp:Transcript_33992/g.57423  ORF Transcript_33992/g.57423 Transcript_33992/m.57423 type:complete len:466 (+) Transcript_33992:54-1451(+)